MEPRILNRKLIALSLGLLFILAISAAHTAWASPWQKGYNTQVFNGAASIKASIWMYDMYSGPSDACFVVGFTDNAALWCTMELCQNRNYLWAGWEPERLGAYVIAINLVFGRTYDFTWQFYDTIPRQATVTVKDTVTGQTWTQTATTSGNRIGSQGVAFMAESADETKANYSPGTWGKMKVYTTSLNPYSDYPTWVLRSYAPYGSYSWITWSRAP